MACSSPESEIDFRLAAAPNLSACASTRSVPVSVEFVATDAVVHGALGMIDRRHTAQLQHLPAAAVVSTGNDESPKTGRLMKVKPLR
jgi:hypothetical protein